MTHEQAFNTMAQVMDYEANQPWHKKDLLLCIVAVLLVVAAISLMVR